MVDQLVTEANTTETITGRPAPGSITRIAEPISIGGNSMPQEEEQRHRHVEVYSQMADKLDEIIGQLDWLVAGISSEIAPPQAKSELKEMPDITLQSFIHHAVSEKIDSFAEEAAKRIHQIRDMLF